MGIRINWDHTLTSSRKACLGILRFLESHKQVRNDLLTMWTAALLARQIEAAKSIQLLANHRQTIDAMSIVRTMGEASITIEYIHHDPSKAREIRNMLEVEGIVDDYELLEMKAYTAKESVQRYAGRDRSDKRVLGLYNKVKDTRLFNAQKGEWPRRLRFIGIDEKYRAIEGKKRPREIKWLFSELGDACVHSRPCALLSLVNNFDDKNISYLGRNRELRFRPTLVRRLAVLCLLCSGKSVSDEYYLPDQQRQTLDKIGRVVAPVTFQT